MYAVIAGSQYIAATAVCRPSQHRQPPDQKRPAPQNRFWAVFGQIINAESWLNNSTLLHAIQIQKHKRTRKPWVVTGMGSGCLAATAGG